MQLQGDIRCHFNAQVHPLCQPQALTLCMLSNFMYDAPPQFNQLTSWIQVISSIIIVYKRSGIYTAFKIGCSQISVIRTLIIRNYWVIRRRWTVPTFSLLSIAIKLPIIRISIIRKNQFFEVIRRSRLKKMLLNYPSRFEVQISGMVIMISMFGRVRCTRQSDLENKVETVNWHRINAHTIT